MLKDDLIPRRMLLAVSPAAPPLVGWWGGGVVGWWGGGVVHGVAIHGYSLRDGRSIRQKVDEMSGASATRSRQSSQGRRKR